MEVWEQHEGEPDKAYERFIFYRDLGPIRSLDAAYYQYVNSVDFEPPKTTAIVKVPKGSKRWKAPGNWQRDSVTYQWLFRANQWDIHVLSQAGRVVIDSFYKTLGVHATQLLELVQTGKVAPVSYSQWLEGFTLIGSFITPEAITAWREFAGDINSVANLPTGNVSSIDAKRGQSRTA